MLILPYLEFQPEALLDTIIQYDFENLSHSSEILSKLSSVPFVKVCAINGTSRSKRLIPRDVIDRTSPLRDLYFEDEKVFGEQQYTAGGKYHNYLSSLGMQSRFDASVAAERIIYYHRRHTTTIGLFDKYKLLLKCLSDCASDFHFKTEQLLFMRLSAIKSGQNCLLPPSACRAGLEQPLVDGVLGIVQLPVDPSLQRAFGWTDNLKPSIISYRIEILASLEWSLETESSLICVLKYLGQIAAQSDGHQIGEYVSSIQSRMGSKPWLPGISAGRWPPERIFFEGAYEFQPYFSQLPESYSELRTILHRFNVIDRPRAHHLVEFIGSLKRDNPLSPRDLNAVIHALERLEMEFRDSIFQNLFVPDIHGILIPVEELIDGHYNDQSKVRYAHARVPSSFAFKYRIAKLEDDCLLLRHLSGPDLFENYFQIETMVTRIANTLHESCLWMALNEFISNAEDCGSASEVVWILDSDDTIHPAEQLFDDELRAWQTPGLYIFNDGVFSESDFKDLVNVGSGGKAYDPSKIGKYGLGALAMYLFTDVPSMISGEYFIMFDPMRRYLPLEYRSSQRRAGLRIPLTQMALRYKDHLEPFVGIRAIHWVYFLRNPYV